MHGIVFSARARTRVDYDHVVLIKSPEHGLFYEFVVIRNDVVSLRDASLFFHHGLEHPGVRFYDVSFLRVLIRLDYLCAGRYDADFRLRENGYLRHASGEKYPDIYRAYPVASCQYHLAGHDVLSYRSYVLPRRRRSAYDHAVFILLSILCHDDCVIRLFDRIARVYYYVVLSGPERHR